MRTLRRLLTAAAGAAILLPVIAWQVPPRLDWARYRTSIAAFATARLGRAVTIGGHVHLTLLPLVALSADKVTLADRGDGISASLGALRLQVAFLPLLAGRVVPLDLVLDKPVVSAPWPLPRATGAVPALAPGFAARTEGGALHLGGLTLTGINAEVHADPDTGAFGAQGTALVEGRPCRFTALIGAPGGDGVAVLVVTLDGQGPLQGSGGSFRGRMLADGALDGTVRARGADFSALLPGPPAPWQAQGALRLAGGEVRAPDLQVQLAGSPGKAAVSLGILPPGRVDASIKLGQIALGGWLAGVAQPGTALPLRLDFQAQAATWRGTTLRDPHLLLQDNGVIAAATLPGGAHVHAAVKPQAGSTELSGPVTLSAPDLPATMAWAGKLAPFLPQPSLFPPHGDLRGRLVLGPTDAALADLTLKLGATTLTGDAGIALAPRPALHAKLAADHLDLTAALTGLPHGAGTAAALFNSFDADLDLTAGTVQLPGLALTHAALQAHGGAEGLILRHAAADLPGLRADASGAIGTDGAMADVHLDVTSRDAAAMPAAWRVPATLWHGPFHLALTAGGPPSLITAVVRADLGDLRAEAEGRIDSTAPRLTATVTLRHPGAPRLLDSLGLPNAQRWLDTGSLAFQTHLTAWPGHIQLQDFSLLAAALHVDGQIDADLSGPTPDLSGRIDAPSLTLPRFDARADTPLPLARLTAWQGQFAIQAGQILWGAETVATGLTGNIAASAGVLRADVAAAHVAGGALTGQAVIDTTAPAPSLLGRFGLTGAAIDDLPTLPLTGGTLDLTAELSAHGYSPAAVLATSSGDAHGTLHGAALAGVDLPKLKQLLLTRGPRLRAALTQAMATGSTGPLSGPFDAQLRNGALALTAPALAGDAGTLAMVGSIDLPARTSDVVVRIMPGDPPAPALGLRFAGPWETAKRALDIMAAIRK